MRRRSRGPVRGELTLEPQLASDVDTASNVVASTLTRNRLGMTLMLLFGGTALVLAGVGKPQLIVLRGVLFGAPIASRCGRGAHHHEGEGNETGPAL